MATQEQKQNVIESIQADYEALPLEKKQAEYRARWQSHIKDFNRLLWSCKDYADYEQTSKEVEEIQERLKAIVERLSLNVK